ncbi:SDR family NAD(P)-dependent oxidoreductase [Nocardiopsis alba]|uniref:SDR family NAD(P)-dependent oxidoreductase n=1 Tax=Nocardiopsis alba TaxID=53437 RepID=A0A7K2IVS1_9ACTN|nr:type I polyketide synthase [Nocardiopsis alba]MYR34079.1 SDR family NAD(P)-dependent oxidoreductase [Nocardiopsis alba]
MATDSDQSAKLVTALRSALKENARLRDRNRELDTRSDPIAIVGMGCRTPGGVDSPEALWRLVSEGREALSPLPHDRGWDLDSLSGHDGSTPSSATDRGGFLDGAADFDAAFFGISPKEAAAMEPQQRQLLEVSWEALERSGIDPSSLTGTATGVYMGVTAAEYGPRMSEGPEDGHLLTGTTPSVASGRIAYLLGLEGPALSVDTACSSSLVAVHLAMRALREGECTLALAGGATVMGTAGLLAEFTRKRGLSADGRCKAFGEGADGTGFSEGAGVVVLERLSDARRNGHRVLALLRGSAINQDGASNGLTAPSGPAQVRVVRSALEDAGLGPTDVDAVEAHGTGTTLGDPIEAQALIESYGVDRERPLLLGSLKSNIGHTQAAAGINGLIKAVCALRAGVMPPTLHADTPTPHVDWGRGTVRVASTSHPLTGDDRPARMGVSSFGISGTNAHAIVEAVVEDDPADERTGGSALLPFALSARTEAALREQALRLRSHLADGGEHAATASLARTLAVGRSRMEHRAIVLADGRDTLSDALDAFASGTPDTRVVSGRSAQGGVTAFVYSGQGAQRVGMGRELHRRYPVFATALDEVVDAFDRHLERPLRSVMWAESGTPEADLLDETLYTQAGVFAFEVALTRLLESAGLTPDYVIGHSIGELAAAYVAGAFSLEDAVTLVAARGRIMQALPEGGVMVAVQAGEEEVRRALEDVEGVVSLAAVNSPEGVVLSGEEDAVLTVAGTFSDRGRRTRRLPVRRAFHSALMDPVLAPFARAADQVSYQRPRIPLVSNLSGGRAGDEILEGDYWVRHVREAVRFGDGVAYLSEAGVTEFVEVGPDGSLGSMVMSCPAAEGAEVTSLFGRSRSEEVLFVEGLAALYTRGVEVGWGALLPEGRLLGDLPTYPFQRRRYWMNPPNEGRVVVETGAATSSPAGEEPGERPLDASTYQEEWVRATGESRAASTGAWLLFASEEGDPALKECVLDLEGHGHRVRVLPVPDGADRAGTAESVARVEAEIGPLTGVALVATSTGSDDGPSTPSLSRDHRTAVALLQGLGDLGTSLPLWCVTRGAVAAGGARVVDPGAALIWGLGRVAAQEHTDRWGGLVDLPSVEESGAGETLGAVLRGEVAPEEDQLAIRERDVLVRRLVRAPLDRTPAVRDGSPSGTVLVTGGTGGLGAHTARRLAERGAEHLLLLSRRGKDAPGSEELLAELRAAGARVSLVACDVADRSALAAVLEEIPEEAPLTAVFHTAAALDDASLDDLGPEQIGRALRAKADGAVNLHLLTRDHDLSTFVLFSSVAAVFGVTGQGNYAPGNTFCEAFAHYRRGLGLSATSIAWGTWAGAGMADDEVVAELLRGHGLPPMDPRRAVGALDRVLERDLTALAVADIDWPRFRAAFTAARPSPLIEGIDPHEGRGGDTDGSASGPGRLRDRLSELGRPDREQALIALVRDQVAVILGHGSGEEVEVDRNLKDLGMDSAAAVMLRGRLAGLTGLPLPAALAFDHPTCEALGRTVEERMFGDSEQVVMERLDGLESAMGEYDGSGEGREAVVERLRDLLRRWSPEESRPTATDREVESASREELFALIDETLSD